MSYSGRVHEIHLICCPSYTDVHPSKLRTNVKHLSVNWQHKPYYPIDQFNLLNQSISTSMYCLEHEPY